MGSTEAAYRYIKENGITAGANYPFKAKEGASCKYNEAMKIATLSDFRRVPISNDDFLRVFNCKICCYRFMLNLADFRICCGRMDRCRLESTLHFSLFKVINQEFTMTQLAMDSSIMQCFLLVMESTSNMENIGSLRTAMVRTTAKVASCESRETFRTSVAFGIMLLFLSSTGDNEQRHSYDIK